MKYRVRGTQVSYGEAIGILLLENFAPFIPGDTANATTYRYPVRFQRVPGLSVKKIFAHDITMYEAVKRAAGELKREGVRAITGDCGFMAVFQQRLAEELGIPVFLSSLSQLPFMGLITGGSKPLGVITANSKALTDEVFAWAGVPSQVKERIRVKGLEDDRQLRVGSHRRGRRARFGAHRTSGRHAGFGTVRGASRHGCDPPGVQHASPLRGGCARGHRFAGVRLYHDDRLCTQHCCETAIPRIHVRKGEEVVHAGIFT